jgi:hypothetical protein
VPVLAWIAIRALMGKNITQIDLDKGFRTAQSPALLAMGLGRRREPALPDGLCASLREPRLSARCRSFGGVIAPRPQAGPAGQVRK